MALMIPTDFVPFDLDATEFKNIEQYITQLQTRPVTTREELEKWLIDRSELGAAIGESKANLYITMTCNTEDIVARDAYIQYVEQVAPKLSPLFFELDKRLVQLADSLDLDRQRYGVLLDATKADVELFREENIPLQTQVAVLSQNYDQTCGAMSVTFDGSEKTLPQMARYQEVTDRATREAAWRAVADRRLKDSAAINEIYDEMIRLRTQMGVNAGYPNFIGYIYKSMHRFDYGPPECERFHKACEVAVVPLARQLENERKTQLGLDQLRPWDLAVDPKGRPPLKPFQNGKDLMSKSLAAFQGLSPRLAELFALLGDGSETRGSRDGSCLDLDTRRGKAPGGYQYMRDRSRRPFIFMNAAGLQRDVETMVHEAGHAFHSYLSRYEPLVEYRTAPIEFAEVASMSMELLSMPHWKGTFYKDEAEFRRACRQNIKQSIVMLPWIAQIDAFQHWVYTNPAHSQQARRDLWVDLDTRLGSNANWSGLEQYRAELWQRQLHIFGMPFYYIEYGIARLGALQLWLIALEQGAQRAIDLYTHALSLGGSRPLPELFKECGLVFDFGPEAVSRLVDRAAKELDKVPD